LWAWPGLSAGAVPIAMAIQAAASEFPGGLMPVPWALGVVLMGLLSRALPWLPLAVASA